MGKQGPCHHCGVTSTPLWRNGPPEKPVLCNACGSRWRTKGSLANYTPLHARAEYDDEIEDHGIFVKAQTVYAKNKEAKIAKRKYKDYAKRFVGMCPQYKQRYGKDHDEDAAINRSSLGSVVSNTEQYGYTDASDFTGPSELIVWDDTVVPSRKRTCIVRPKPSSVEKLAKDLYTIWHDQQSSLCFSASSEEESVLLESDKPIVSVEIGHGSVLMKHPRSIAHEEEESEASSFVYSQAEAFHAHEGTEKTQIRRGRDQFEKLRILGHHGSPPLYDRDQKESKGKSIINDSEDSGKSSALAECSMLTQGSRDEKHQTSSGNVVTLIYNEKQVTKKNGCSNDPKSLYSYHIDDGGGEILEQDLLLDFPSTSSFMQAELIPTSSIETQPVNLSITYP